MALIVLFLEILCHCFERLVTVCIYILHWYMQARARIELREEATEQDAHDVIEIMKYR